MLAERKSARHANIGERAVRIVPKQQITLSVIRYGKIGPTVEIKVQFGNTQRFAERRHKARGFGAIHKRAIPFVHIIPALHPGIHGRVAIQLDRSPKRTKNVRFRRPCHIVRDIQIGVPVPVRIKENSGTAPDVVPFQTRLARCLDESPPFVSKEKIFLETGDIEVRVPVVVVVGSHHPYRIPIHTGQTRRFRYLGERAVAIVPIQKDCLDRRFGIPIATAKEQNVTPAIAVVIEKSPSGPHLLGIPLVSGSAIDMPEGAKAGFRGNIRKNRKPDTLLICRLRGRERTSAQPTSSEADKDSAQPTCQAETRDRIRRKC